MASNKGKNVLINLSSSSSFDDNGDDDDSASDSASSSSGDECELIDDDDAYVVEDDESEEDDCLDEDCYGVEDDDLTLSNRVIQFLQGRRDLQELSLKACKAYLRRHDLRVSGNKEECVHRVQEHYRIKDGKAEILYPSSTFVINCTGDVCKGDTVIFKQKVYGSFDKVTRQGKLMGKRTVAGRVVKESYGAAKQQHTFTVEVLWSKGIKKLPPLFPMLIKGRNLYRLKTWRQPWKNEGERRKVLAEKHRRGTAARYMRAKRKNALPTVKGGKSRKVSRRGRPSQMNYPKGGKHFGTEQGASSSINNYYTNQQSNVKQEPVVNSNREKFSKRIPQKLVSHDDRASTLHSFHGVSQNYSESLVGHHRSSPYGLHSADFLSSIPYHGAKLMSAEQNGNISHSSFCDSYGIQLQRVTHTDPRQFFPLGAAHRQWMNDILNCSIHGCHEPGSTRCVIAACWRCCQRVGMVCNVHR